MSGLKSQALWLLFSNFFSAILQIIQISVLARHLELHELGVLAIVNSILMIAMILQDGQVLCNAKSCPFGYVGQY